MHTTSKIRRTAAMLAWAAALMLPVALLAAVDTSKFKEVDFSGLNDAQIRTAIRIMSVEKCNCGCGFTIADCRDKDSSCRRSLIFSRTVIDALRENKSEAEAVKLLRAKSSTFVEAKLPDDSGVVYDIKVGDSPIRGSKDAPVTIMEFSDFQCPYCASLQTALEQVLKAFPRDVRLVYKQYPLNIHQYARQAAAASLAAHAQGKFWQFHDKLFQNFQAINEENLKRWAKEAGLNMADFEKTMQSGKYEPAIQKDMTDGAAAKVVGTPTIFVNGRRLQGERTFEGIKKMVLDELAALKVTPAPSAAAPRTPAKSPAKTGN